MSSTGPSTVTYLYGTSSDCTQIVARRERRNSSALRDCGPIANAMLPSSAVNQIGDETGARSGASTLKTQTRGTSVRKVHRSAGVIVRSIRLLRSEAGAHAARSRAVVATADRQFRRGGVERLGAGRTACSLGGPSS